MKNSVLLAIVSAALLALLAVPANAQATRTWISGVGDDANPCSRTAPCKTFAGAISKTTPQGEINCLDPGGFGALTITKAISIKCDAVSNGGVLVAGTNGIVVAAPAGAVVYLSGLDFEGLGPGSGSGTPAGLNGISVTSGGTVYIINCSIRDFGTSGVSVATSGTTRVIIKDSIIVNNGTAGTANTGGIVLKPGGGASNGVDIYSTLVDANANFAVQATGSTSGVRLVRSYLTGSPISFNLVSGAVGVLQGPSNFIQGTVNGTTTSVAFQ
jgi:hypothetical protein